MKRPAQTLDDSSITNNATPLPAMHPSELVNQQIHESLALNLIPSSQPVPTTTIPLQQQDAPLISSPDSTTPTKPTLPNPANRSPLRQRLKLDLDIPVWVPNCPSPPILSNDAEANNLYSYYASSSSESTPFITSIKHSLSLADQQPSLPFLDPNATPRLPSSNSLRRAQSIPSSPSALMLPATTKHSCSVPASAVDDSDLTLHGLPELPPAWALPTAASVLKAFSASPALVSTAPDPPPAPQEPEFMTTLAPKQNIVAANTPQEVNIGLDAGSSSDEDSTYSSSFDTEFPDVPTDNVNVEGPITHQYGRKHRKPFLKDHPHGHVDPFTGAVEVVPHPDDSDWDQDTIDFISNVPPLNPIYTHRTSLLPPIQGSKTHTLVLDLDETLLHCTTTPLPEAGLTFAVDFNGIRFDIYGNLRPGVQKFLRRVSRAYELVIFTASQQVYAERALQALDPHNKYISHVLHRDHCVPILGNYLKDLGVLGRDLRRTLIVDNAPQAFAYHPANGLPIRSWYDDPTDHALQRLARRLLALSQLSDVRPAIRAMSHVHARLEDHARLTGRVPVGLAMSYDTSHSPLPNDPMDVDWPPVHISSRPASDYPQLWVGPATLPPSVIRYLGIDLAIQAHHIDDRVDRAPSPAAMAAEEPTEREDLEVMMAFSTNHHQQDHRCVTPSLAERRRGVTSTPEPLRLPLAESVPLPQSTLTTPVTGTNGQYASSPALADDELACMAKGHQSTPLPTPMTAEFQDASAV